MIMKTMSQVLFWSQRVQRDNFFSSQIVQKIQSYATSINYILTNCSITEGVDATQANSYSVINENNIGQMDANSIVRSTVKCIL
jgi:hypothetical protein